MIQAILCPSLACLHATKNLYGYCFSALVFLYIYIYIYIYIYGIWFNPMVFCTGFSSYRMASVYCSTLCFRNKLTF